VSCNGRELIRECERPIGRSFSGLQWIGGVDDEMNVAWLLGSCWYGGCCWISETRSPRRSRDYTFQKALQGPPQSMIYRTQVVPERNPLSLTSPCPAVRRYRRVGCCDVPIQIRLAVRPERGAGWRTHATRAYGEPELLTWDKPLESRDRVPLVVSRRHRRVSPRLVSGIANPTRTPRRNPRHLLSPALSRQPSVLPIVQ